MGEPIVPRPDGTPELWRRALHWMFRARKSSEERRTILSMLFPTEGDAGHWWFRFAVMMSLSTVIAVMGLSTNSDAIVIGAMLIAPLMTPVLGVSASLVMVWPGRLGRSILAVVAGSVGAVVISWALTALLPHAEQLLTPEVLSRTGPDLRDLIVALAAGAAGAYATTRKDIPAVLPGVAVAVALLPPLAVVGYTLAVGRTDLAGGAFLLFTVNIVAIVFAGGVVLLASGFVPIARLRSRSRHIQVGMVAAALFTIALAIPLTNASLRSASQAQVTQDVNQSVVTWLNAYPKLKVNAVSVSGNDVAVTISGPTSPPSTQSLVRILKGVLGADAAARVQWYQTSENALVITTSSGTVGVPLELSTSSDATTGALSYSVVGGTAAGCELSGPDILNVTSAGTCLVVATEAIDANETTSSAPTTVTFVKAHLTLTLTPTPAVEGPPKVGRVLRVVAGTWDTGVSLHFRWLRNGHPIAGATSSTFRPTAGEVHDLIRVRVTGTKVGFVAVTKTSGGVRIKR